MTWLKYITIHPGINIGLQYIRNTNEYILKLQLHQQKNLNVTLSSDFECEKPHETPLLEITRKDNKMKTLRDDILSIIGQVTSKTRLDMVNRKNIPRIHVQGKWDNNNKVYGVQIQVTNERKMTNYCINTKHIPNTSSKKNIKESMTLFQHKTRMKIRQQ